MLAIIESLQDPSSSSLKTVGASISSPPVAVAVQPESDHDVQPTVRDEGDNAEMSGDNAETSSVSVHASGEKLPDAGTTDDGFAVVVKRRRQRTGGVKLGGNRPAGGSLVGVGSSLRGAQRVDVQPFHLAGISLDSSVDDIVAH